MIQTLAGTAGVVVAALPNAMFRVRLDDGVRITAYAAGKIKLSKAKVLVGDRVLVRRGREESKLGGIVYRYKP
ncbi:MAG: translation initiation factor IF-1 [Candidatus Hodgkinia cicadicola]